MKTQFLRPRFVISMAMLAVANDAAITGSSGVVARAESAVAPPPQRNRDAADSFDVAIR
jgi:hypothetical protein